MVVQSIVCNFERYILQMEFMRKIYVFAVLLLTLLNASAATLDQAKTLYNKGNYSEALPTFKELLAQSPKDASLNHWTGVCLYKTGNYSEAIPLLEFASSKNVAESPRYLAYIAFDEYRFDDAENYITKYHTILAKNKKVVPADIETLSAQILNARNMLQRVEQVQIIDSINVDSDTFFKFYKLSRDAGSLNATTTLPAGFSATTPSVVFKPESQTPIFWAMTNSVGASQLVTSAMLSDGTWEKPHPLGSNLNDGGNANYPYIMPDGVTLYFANDGENSIGKYDIFITRKDDDTFLQPQNMGMPYNSPHNDYMLVIDETTGIGWWATDRNRIEGKVTIYMFIPNESRANYPTDTPNLVNLAKINAIKDSWLEGADYSSILARLNNIDMSTPNNSGHDFTLSLPNGDVYHSLSDFKNEAAATAMQEYLDALQAHNAKKSQLTLLRKKYSDGDKSVAQQILSLEQLILDETSELVRLRNIAVSLENKQQS